MGIKHLFALQDGRAQYFSRPWLFRRRGGGLYRKIRGRLALHQGLRRMSCTLLAVGTGA